MSISFNLDKKLIFLVMIVSVVALSITGFLSFSYSDEILKQRVGDQLIGEFKVVYQVIRPSCLLLLKSYCLEILERC